MAGPAAVRRGEQGEPVDGRPARPLGPAASARAEQPGLDETVEGQDEARQRWRQPVDRRGTVGRQRLHRGGRALLIPKAVSNHPGSARAKSTTPARRPAGRARVRSAGPAAPPRRLHPATIPCWIASATAVSRASRSAKWR